VELPTIAASLPSLNQAYQIALSDTQTDKSEQGATFVSTNQDRSAKLREHAAQILSDSDPVQAAQRNQRRGLGQIATNHLSAFLAEVRKVTRNQANTAIPDWRRSLLVRANNGVQKWHFLKNTRLCTPCPIAEMLVDRR